MSETDNRTASQRITDLEKVVTMLYQAAGEQADQFKNVRAIQGDMALIKDALKLLNKKTEAIVQVAKAETGITVDTVSALVVKMNIEDLTTQVSTYVANGFLVPADEVAEISYLVCEEQTSDGTVANPRIQFRLDSQDQVTQDALKGKKAGDVVSFGENKLSAKILEVYTLSTPKPPEEPAVQPVEVSDVVVEVSEITLQEAASN